jgi:hypothetical protein
MEEAKRWSWDERHALVLATHKTGQRRSGWGPHEPYARLHLALHRVVAGRAIPIHAPSDGNPVYGTGVTVGGLS